MWRQRGQGLFFAVSSLSPTISASCCRKLALDVLSTFQDRTGRSRQAGSKREAEFIACARAGGRGDQSRIDGVQGGP